MNYQLQFCGILLIFCLFIDIAVSTEFNGKTGSSFVNIDDLSIQSELDSFPKDCRDFLPECSGPESSSGVYLIKPEGYKEPFDVYCNNDLDGGGWTVIQRRLDGTIDFERGWESYKDGFGFLHTEFWIGNEKLAYLTNQNKYALRIDIINSTGARLYLYYDHFRITEENGSYAIVDLGRFTGNTSEGYNYMQHLEGVKFSTHDNDNDDQNSNCADRSQGGWWFDRCNSDIYLNGVYKQAISPIGELRLRNRDTRVRENKLRFTEMKIRPL